MLKLKVNDYGAIDLTDEDGEQVSGVTKVTLELTAKSWQRLTLEGRGTISGEFYAIPVVGALAARLEEWQRLEELGQDA